MHGPFASSRQDDKAVAAVADAATATPAPTKADGTTATVTLAPTQAVTVSTTTGC